MLSPDLSTLGNPPFAIVGRGKVSEFSWNHEGTTIHGKGLKLRCGPQSQAATFRLESSGALRYVDKDPALQLLLVDAAGGQQQTKEGQNVNLHATLEHPEWKQMWTLNPVDFTIGPDFASNPLCAGLCLGVDPDGEGEVIMVPRTDASRRLIFGGTLMEQYVAHAANISKAFPPTLPNSDAVLLIIKSPPLPWLGSGQNAIVQTGGLHQHVMQDPHKGLHGKWGKLIVGKAIDAAEWFVDGDPNRMALRLQSDRRVALD